MGLKKVALKRLRDASALEATVNMSRGIEEDNSALMDCGSPIDTDFSLKMDDVRV